MDIMAFDTYMVDAPCIFSQLSKNVSAFAANADMQRISRRIAFFMTICFYEFLMFVRLSVELRRLSVRWSPWLHILSSL